ncbi:glycosyltransferase [Allokutzneria sp. A3M-2-11 16]|uniref:glycosyltransferase n=1 Tax=Allokutzneria sp. A3M-2-11 16 TaxID=2962043 RepID=UPI0020B838EB|nr:glycosyltransferase [Allokutzneria sp. A3M-2-11 16]MCP3800873.1 glycosyltransferase [Allokutzneria sp. A3M-2-11 16]
MLCTVSGSPSHTRSVVPIARALAARGHEVLVAAPPNLAALFADEPVRAEGVLGGFEAGLRKALTDAPSLDPMATLLRLSVTSIPADEAERVLPIAREFRPDLVLRDDAELGAILVAERLGVPCVTLPGGLVNVVDPEMMRSALSDHVQIDLPTLFPDGRIDYVPGEFSFTVAPAPPARAYRQPVLTRPGEQLPGWLPEGPLVLVAMGTALTMPLPGAPRTIDATARLRAMAEELSEVDCSAVVVTAGLDVAGVPLPSNVHVTPSVPQPLVLEVADLFLTHGGYNGIREALRSGVPMVVWPGVADQPSNAVRVEELGLGLRIDGPEHVRSACTRVLSEPGFVARARQAKRAVLALPDLDEAVTDLEKLGA